MSKRIAIVSESRDLFDDWISRCEYQDCEIFRCVTREEDMIGCEFSHVIRLGYPNQGLYAMAMLRVR